MSGFKSDAHARESVLSHLKIGLDRALRQAERNQAAAADRRRTARLREVSGALAVDDLRQAAHYKQAIGLLTAAPMPAEDT